MYQESHAPQDESVRQFLGGDGSYNRHSSAALEVDDAGAQTNNPDEDTPQLDYNRIEQELRGNSNEEDPRSMVRQDIPAEYSYMANEYQNQYDRAMEQHELQMQQQAMAQQQMMHPYHAQQFQQNMQHHILYDQMPPMHQLPGNQMGLGQHPAYQHTATQQQVMNHNQQRGPPGSAGSEDHPGPPVSARKKTKTQYPWLEVSGPACLSERQEARVTELSNVSKKYKSMRCLYCAKFNPITPWASMRPRKYEMSSLQDHANSAHHQKSEKLRADSMAYPALVSSVVYQIPEEATTQAAPPGVQSGAPLSGEPTTASSAATSAASQAAPVVTTPSPAPVPTTAAAPTPPPPSAAVANAMPPMTVGMNSVGGLGMKPINKNKRNLMELTKTHATRGALRPVWLHTEGGLIFSDRQLSDPDRPASLVRKYQMMMCTLCAAHSPRSPWAVMKPRKFEARLLAEHELSTHHQKSLNSAQYPPMASSLPPLPVPVTLPASVSVGAGSNGGGGQGQGAASAAAVAQGYQSQHHQAHAHASVHHAAQAHHNASQHQHQLSAGLGAPQDSRYGVPQPAGAHQLLQHSAGTHIGTPVSQSSIHAQQSHQHQQQLPLHVQQQMMLQHQHQQQLQQQRQTHGHQQQQQNLGQHALHPSQQGHQTLQHVPPHLAHLQGHGGMPSMHYAHQPAHLLPEHALQPQQHPQAQYYSSQAQPQQQQQQQLHGGLNPDQSAYPSHMYVSQHMHAGAGPQYPASMNQHAAQQLNSHVLYGNYASQHLQGPSQAQVQQAQPQSAAYAPGPDAYQARSSSLEHQGLHQSSPRVQAQLQEAHGQSQVQGQQEGEGPRGGTSVVSSDTSSVHSSRSSAGGSQN